MAGTQMKNKKIYFERTEDVKLTYIATLYKNDWDEFKEWAEADPAAWEVIKDMSFEDALDIIANNKVITWEDKFLGDTYTEYFDEYLSSYLRDIAIERGAVDEDYYEDGGDETLLVENC